ncbi:conserved hypothetical protein [Vibrio coralliirubri]|uniref:GmrSD restriction endonucleases N-terminal domain-containing protein n=1 Tax=Vibrio coralliirubri TaxID=1516159 RepID=A0AA86XQR6_9VIBR|nr:DUF262 domain-containing protein [Vibrio coralliirubri]CDT74021.1 conserved hypothetical protein [Vibrio coralliirubri]
MTELTKDQQKIKDEIERARHSIKTDGYPMSIGEITNLYRDGEIKLDPAFQRLFRWDNQQKTKLIESILIGIPIPEIFVAQKADGNWHVVDGVQRLSTTLQLIGALEDKEPLVMTSCKYIPSLENKTWKDLPIETQREFRKSKLKINIILTQNSDEAQYELFQRLNTGGTSLSDQEVRNCLILMISPEFYEEINRLKKYPNFLDCLRLEKHNFDKEFHMELILRMFIGYANIVDYKEHGSISSILLSEFIDRETINLIRNADIDGFSSVFKRTFDQLKNCLNNESFLKYDHTKEKFYGSFNVSTFEMITTGISSNIDKVENLGKDELKKSIVDIYKEDAVIDLLKHGTKAIKRFKGLTEFSRTYFN